MAQGKMCPLLTAGIMAQQKIPTDADGIQQSNGAFDAMMCQGEACAWWVPIADETGKRSGEGNCAMPLTAIATSLVSVNTTPKGPKIVKG